MTDIIFGSIDSRQLHLRAFCPAVFDRWDGNTFRFSPLRLLNPLRWWRAAKHRCSWRLHWNRYRGNHRCYCYTGRSFDGAVVLCGFGLLWWYSHYDGEIPCWCDKALEEIQERDERERRAEVEAN